MLTDFQNSYTDGLNIKFAVNSSQNIPSHLKCIATLPCEVLISEMLKTANNPKHAP